MEALERAKEQQPDYVPNYEKAAEELYSQLMNRPKFTYDARSDALYQNYKQSYLQQGQLAMQDAMGRAAALTGGYGSSYSQALGQQQYNAYLQKLTQIFPETYQMAYQNYQNRGAQLQNQYNMVQDLSDKEYAQYQDKLAAYYQQLSDLQQRADVEYDREVAAEQQAYDRAQDEYKKQQDAYDRLADMMTTLGYVPTAEEMAAAGMSQSAMQAYRNYYVASITPVSYGGGSKKKSTKKTTSKTTSALEQAREALARTGNITAVNSGVVQQVARGEITAAEGRTVLATISNEYYASKSSGKK